MWHAAAASVFAIVCCGCSSAAFDPMPPDANNLTPALGPVTGTGSTTFTVTATRSMSLTMGCIGTGILTVLGPLSGEVMCDGPSLGRGTFAGYYWSHLRARPGERLRLRIVANPKMAWDIRVDGLPRHCEGDARANCERLVDHGMSSI